MIAPHTAAHSSYAALSPSRKRLVDLMRQRPFCRVEGLSISNGEPQFSDPPPTIIQTVRLPVETDAQEPTGDDFILKKQIVELFEYFDHRQTAMVSRIEWRFGLPCFMEIVIQEDRPLSRRSDGRNT